MLVELEEIDKYYPYVQDEHTNPLAILFKFKAHYRQTGII